MNIKKIFIWHLSGGQWDKVMEKYEVITSSFAAVHQRYLDKRKRAGGFGNKHNKRTD